MTLKQSGNQPEDNLSNASPESQLFSFESVEKGVDVTTKRGFKFKLRKANPDDEKIVDEFYQKLSPDEIQMRFGTKDVPQDYVGKIIDPESGLMAAIALIENEGTQEVIATCEYGRGDYKDFPDFAILVDENHQGKGIGRELFKWAASDAKRRGYTGFNMDLHTENRKIQGFADKIGAELSYKRSDVFQDAGDRRFQIEF